MKPVKFGKLKIGGNNPVVIIAEIGVDHVGDMSKAKKMIEMARHAGADVAKFQIHLPHIEMVPDNSIKFHGGSLFDFFKKSHLTGPQHRELKDHCEKIGIEYLCTPFCPASVDILNDIVEVKAFKTGSGEITNLPQHRKLAKISAKTGKPVLVSTGMCTMDEIADTVSVYREESALKNLVLMNCTSEYPLTRYEDISLGLIEVFKNKFGVLVGQSDHAINNAISFAAVAKGAKIIEKHFTLSYGGPGCDDSVALEPKAFGDLVKGIRENASKLNKRDMKIVELASGSEKTVRLREWPTRNWAFHSVVTNRPIKKNEKISLTNVRPARPGKGIPAKFLDKKYSGELMGLKVKKYLPKNYILNWADLEI